MWLLFDKDSSRSEKTVAYLRKQNVSAHAVLSEDAIPESDNAFTVAIFADGWNQATVEKVKKTFNVNALLCLPQVLQTEQYKSVIEQGYSDVVPYPPAPDYVRSWENHEVGREETPYLNRILEGKKNRSRYTTVVETIPFESGSTPRRGEVITVVGVKGGVGKTITTSLLASEYKQHGKRVVVADLDPQGNLSILHKVDRTVTTDRFETLPSALNEAELEQNMIKTPLGWWLVPKGERPLGLSEHGVSRLIHLLSAYADVVLLDCHPGNVISTAEAMKQADWVLAVTTSDRSGWSELPGFLKQTEKPIQLLINRAKENKRALQSIRTFLEEQTGYPVIGIIPEDISLYNRVQEGLSVLGNSTTNGVIRSITTKGQNQARKGWFK